MTVGSLLFGVVFRLQVKGALCPCLLNSEDANARQAVRAVNGSCRRVQIHPVRLPNGKELSPKSSFFLGGLLFGRSNSSNSTSAADTVRGGGGSGSSEQHGPPSSCCLAQLVLQDSGADGQPEIMIDPVGNSVEDEDVAAGGDRNSKQQQQQRKGGPATRNVKLRRVDKVLLEGDQIVLKAKAASGQPAASARELLRFTVLQCATTAAADEQDDVVPNAATEAAVLPVTQDTRNMLVHHFMVLSEWERQRRAALQASDPDTYNDDSDGDDDDDTEDPLYHPTNFLTSRAQKAAHFAQRELELQRTKKEREKRKAKLISEAGGLKYTAIAMANMNQSPSK